MLIKVRLLNMLQNLNTNIKTKLRKSWESHVAGTLLLVRD